MRSVLSFVFSFLSLAVQAQGDYTPMLKDGRKWFVEYRETVGLCYDGIYRKGKVLGTNTYAVVGDTVVGGREMKVIRLERSAGMERVVFFGAFEENRKLYEFDFESGKSSCVMSFLLSDWDFITEYMKTEEDWILVRGNVYHRLKLSTHPDYYVEGIGMIHDLWFDMREIPVSRSNYLAAVYDGDELIFEYDDFFVPAYVPGQGETNGIEEVKAELFKQKSGATYDLSGRRVSQPQRGIYLRDGRKFVVR